MIRSGFGVQGVVFRDNCHYCCSYTIIMVEGSGLSSLGFGVQGLLHGPNYGQMPAKGQCHPFLAHGQSLYIGFWV